MKRSIFRRDRIVRLLVTVVLLVTYGGAALELVLVAHARCSHGQLVHVDSAHADSGFVFDVDGHAEPSAEPLRIDPDTGEHDHCGILSGRYRPGLLRPHLSTPLLTSRIFLPVRAASIQGQPIPVLLLAPKASPPCF